MKTLFAGVGGAVGGAVVDLIYISFAGPSGLFTLLGITQRADVFLAHVVLGAILGVLFALISKKVYLNIWLLGFIYSMLVMGLIGGIPSFILGLVNSAATIFGFIVWTLYGLILSGAIVLAKEIK